MSAWLTVVGIGEDGCDGLPEPSRRALREATLIVGGARQLFQLGDADAGAAFGDFFGLAGQDLLQNRRHTHCAFSSL